MPKYTPMGRALGLDLNAIARAVSACVREDRALNVDEMTAAMGGVLPSKGAITMKYAVKEGYFERTTRDPQDRWFPTEKGLKTFPVDEAHVMPDQPTVELGEGRTFTGVSPEEAATWTGDDEGWTEIDPTKEIEP